MLSVNTDAIRARIRRLPEKVETMANSTTKRDALMLIAFFREGLEESSFPLPPLQLRTVQRKRKKGYSKPDNPLRGMGMEGTRTLASSLRVYKGGRGWVVKMPEVKHHESKLTVAHLLNIHENGLAIKGAHGAVIRIPARPVFAMAYAKVMQWHSERDPSAEVQAACTEILNGGDNNRERAIMAEVKRLEAMYGTVD